MRPDHEIRGATPGPDLGRFNHIHVVGVGGPGMSAIALVLVSMGHTVTGSDLKDSPGLARLRARGITVTVGHDPANVGDADALAVSTAVPVTNPEVRAAEENDVAVLWRPELLSGIAASRRTLAVSGTHGKTTTTAMLALVLIEAGLAPSFIIGGEVTEIGSGAVWDHGDWFVVEADESDGTFTRLAAETCVVTNVEADHLNFYGTRSAIDAAFDRFVVQSPTPAICCVDDPGAARLARDHDGVGYGTAPGAEYRITDPVTDRSSSAFTLHHDGTELGRVVMPVPGMHNIRNATAAIVAGLRVGADMEAATRALGRFAGVSRRFQHRGRAAGVTVVDDYAHNPGKVAAVLAAAAAGDWSRVVAVFQPHRYSRTEDLRDEFGDAFVDADRVVIADVFGAGEAPRPGVRGKTVVDAVLDRHPWAEVAWIPQRDDIVAYLASRLRDGDLCLTLGAGDVTTWGDRILAALRDREPGAPVPEEGVRR